MVRIWYAFMTTNLLLQEIQMLRNIIAMLNFITESNLFLGNDDRSQKSSMYCKEFLYFHEDFYNANKELSCKLKRKHNAEKNLTLQGINVV